MKKIKIITDNNETILYIAPIIRKFCLMTDILVIIGYYMIKIIKREYKKIIKIFKTIKQDIKNGEH